MKDAKRGKATAPKRKREDTMAAGRPEDPDMGVSTSNPLALAKHVEKTKSMRRQQAKIAKAKPTRLQRAARA